MPGFELIGDEEFKEVKHLFEDSKILFRHSFDHLRNNIQDPVHIVPEVALDGWIRGGAPSRQIVKDIEYLEKCGSKYQKMAAQKYQQ